MAAVGRATAAAIAARGIVADVVAEQAVQGSLVEALGDAAGRRVLVATAEGRVRCSPTAFGSGERRSRCSPLPDAPRTGRCGRRVAADLVTFTSSSTVTNVLEALAGRDLGSLRTVSIGPVTSGTLREHGVEPLIEADPHDVEGLVEAVLRAAVQ